MGVNEYVGGGGSFGGFPEIVALILFAAIVYGLLKKGSIVRTYFGLMLVTIGPPLGGLVVINETFKAIEFERGPLFFAILITTIVSLYAIAIKLYLNYSTSERDPFDRE